MKTHMDALETRDPAARESALLAALPGQIAQAQKNAPAFAEILKDIKAASRAAGSRVSNASMCVFIKIL